MAAQARENAKRPLLKLKIGGPGDLDRVGGRARRRAQMPSDRGRQRGPDLAALKALAPDFAKLGVMLIEQPLKAARMRLEGYDCPVPLCADRKPAHPRANWRSSSKRYRVANIKLDKTGGLTEALR